MNPVAEATPSRLAGDALADVADQALAAEDLSSAIALFDRAEPDVTDPDRCAGGRWMAYMLQGEFPAAWRESDAIRRRGAPDPHRFWNGEPLQGRRLMLRSLHGFGDAVQMFRFLPRLREQVSELIVEVPPKLVPLAPFFDGVDRVITWGEGSPAEPPAWDVQMEVMEVPYALRVSASDLRPTHGYLRLPEQERTRVRALLGGRSRPRVGLVWSAGEWNPSRSVPFPSWEALLKTAGVEFWSLQGEPARQQWKTNAGEDAHCRDVYACGDGLLPLAAVIEQMDLVITVDTLSAHLAGALNVPGWVLLQHRADWRWMLARRDTPWYPSLQLWRQPREGEWLALLGIVRQELDHWMQNQNRQGTAWNR